MFSRFFLKAFNKSSKSSSQHFSRITKLGIKIVTLSCIMMKNDQTLKILRCSQKVKFLLFCVKFYLKRFTLTKVSNLEEQFLNFSSNPLSSNITKWSNTLKQFVGNLATNCLSVFDNFVGLALEGLNCHFGQDYHYRN